MTDSLRARAMQALGDHIPEHTGVDLRDLGSGLDHAAFLAGDLVVRVSVSPEPPKGPSTEPSREAQVLALVARHVAVPVPVPRFADPELGVLAYPLLPGSPLLGRTAPPGAAATMGRFLRELHAIDPADVAGLVRTEDDDPRAWLDGLDGPEPLLEQLRADPPGPAGRRVLCHADLGAEHILTSGDVITGVIDWGDAALADPALDFARLYRDFGPAFLHDTLAAYGAHPQYLTPRLMPRIQFYARCAALEDLTYGQQSGRLEYSRAAERSLSWLFPSPNSQSLSPGQHVPDGNDSV